MGKGKQIIINHYYQLLFIINYIIPIKNPLNAGRIVHHFRIAKKSQTFFFCVQVVTLCADLARGPGLPRLSYTP